MEPGDNEVEVVRPQHNFLSALDQISDLRVSPLSGEVQSLYSERGVPFLLFLRVLSPMFTAQISVVNFGTRLSINGNGLLRRH